jgi:hypothetical protein
MIFREDGGSGGVGGVEKGETRPRPTLERVKGIRTFRESRRCYSLRYNPHYYRNPAVRLAGGTTPGPLGGLVPYGTR